MHEVITERSCLYMCLSVHWHIIFSKQIWMNFRITFSISMTPHGRHPFIFLEDGARPGLRDFINPLHPDNKQLLSRICSVGQGPGIISSLSHIQTISGVHSLLPNGQQLLFPKGKATKAWADHSPPHLLVMRSRICTASSSPLLCTFMAWSFYMGNLTFTLRKEQFWSTANLPILFSGFPNDTSTTYRSALRHTQPPMQWVPALFPGG
jgi:hypothetical protein